MIDNTTPLPPVDNRPFSTPDGFLGQLPEEIIRRAATQSPKGAAKRNFRIMKFVLPAAAAAAIAVVLGNLPANTPAVTPLSSEQAFAALSAEDQTELLNYYTDNIYYDDNF